MLRVELVADVRRPGRLKELGDVVGCGQLDV
jgi:hypothetical protein